MNPNQIARIGSLVGDPARAAMLMALMHGQSLTATELARCAHITPATASSHLSKLVAAGLLKLSPQGRHRYHRIATPQAARLIESIMQLASAEPPTVPAVVTGPRDAAMRIARTCYDHLAGGLGVAIADSLVEAGFVEFDDELGIISDAGISHLASAGINLSQSGTARRKSNRPMCRPCLDWSMRRPHIAGTVGAAICDHFIDNHLVARVNGSRTLLVTPKGERALFDIFAIRSLV